MNIRQRIFIPMITLAIISSTAVLVSSIVLYNRNLENAAYNRINVAAAAVEHEIFTYKQSSRMAAVFMAEDRIFRQAIINKDRNGIIQRAYEMQNNTQMDFCTVVDNEGIVLARTHESDRYGDNILYQYNIYSALLGNTETVIEQGTVSQLAVRTGVPVKDDNGNIAGVVSLGRRLDVKNFVDALKAITGCEITIFLGSERISTTNINEKGTFVLGTKLDSSISQKVLAGESYTGRIKALGRNALTVYSPLYSINDNIVGIFCVGEYTTEDESKIKTFIISGAFITLVVLAVCILFGIYITRSVDRQLGAALDVVQETIREKKELGYLLNVLNGLDAMIYVTEPETGEILFINESMKKHYDIKYDVVGKICYKVLQKGLDKRCDFCPCFKLDENPYAAIEWEEHSTKTNRIYRNVDRYIPWLNGKTVHIQHSVDMTELISAKEYAEQSSRYKSAFLATMSHEIRTPMNAILGIAEIQLRDEKLTGECEEAFLKIFESGNLLLNIINDILDLSKIEAGKMELIPVKYDVPGLISNTVQLNLLRYENKPITFNLDVNENLPQNLFGDELRIKQILNNLLSNAFKYTEKGEVRLSVYTEQILEENKHVHLVFKVSDTGQGMSQEQLKKLFDKYTRFNLEANRTTIGTGLGMNITKNLLDMMKGDISVESILGKGSVFTVKIPQKKIGSAVFGAEMTHHLKTFSFHSSLIDNKRKIIREYMPYGKVLVVDDVESNIYVVKRMLLTYGLSVDTACSGFEAIEKIERGETYDIIFMDHMMPNMDGIETVKKLREMNYTKTIVALTANAIVGQADMFLNNGFNGFISKPIDSRELDHVLNDFIRNKKPPKIVRKARKEQREKREAVFIAQNEVRNTEIYKFFLHDAEKAIDMLEKVMVDLRNMDNESFAAYSTIVHGMKSALSNIGENKMSSTAQRLEKAGEDQNIVLIMEETPVFMEELNTLTEIIKKKIDINMDDNIELSDDDNNFFRQKMIELKNVCIKFDKRSAKEILNELKQKQWPRQITEIIDALTLHLLHSSFEEAAVLIDNSLNSKS